MSATPPNSRPIEVEVALLHAEVLHLRDEARELRAEVAAMRKSSNLILGGVATACVLLAVNIGLYAGGVSAGYVGGVFTFLRGVSPW